jgi:hypothetical protein
MATLPLNLSLEAVTRNTRLVLNNRDLRTHEPVEQGALANIRPTDNDNGC